MPVVVLIGVFIVVVAIYDWVSKHPPLGTFIEIGFFGLVAWAIWSAIKKTTWYQQVDRTRRDNEAARIVKERAAAEACAAKQNAESISIAWQNTDPIPRPEEFRASVKQLYLQRIQTPLREEYLEQILDVQLEVLRRADLDPKKHPPQQAWAAYRTIVACCVDGLVAFTAKINPTLLSAPQPPTVFATRISHTECVGTFYDDKDGHLQFQFVSNGYSAFKELAKPFTTKQQLLTNFFAYSKFFPNTTYPDSDRYEDKSDFKAAVKQHEKWNQELIDLDLDYDKAVWQTPYYNYGGALVPKSSHLEPFHIPAEARSRHQWIVGAPGAGKTTFISAMIADDLKKVARNECSIFVMDSQNELLPDISKLEMFAPGRPLHNKLIYLEPDPDFPLALNIFDTNKARSQNLSSKEKAMLESGAIWMVEFFLSSLVKSESSPHQDTFLQYVVPALMAIPDATIFTFKDLLDGAKVKNGPTGYDRYKQHFTGLRQDTQDWLRERMHSPEMAMTRNAIRTRLDGFTARGFFHDMFMHPRNKLDLFDEMQTGKVILVNTMKGLLKNGTEPFGRYFIARLLQAAEERMFVSRGGRLPVYVYIDEASDYIAEEENIEELINKARKQNVALIIANQMESQITSPIVRDALSRVAIQCRGEPGDVGQPPKWEIAIGTREPVQVQVPNVNFSDMPQMSAAHHEEMLKDMRRRFSTPAGAHHGNSRTDPPPRQEEKYQEPPRQDRRAGPPKDDEYDDRYDILEVLTVHPGKALRGFVLTVTCPNKRSHQENIPPNTESGYRFCVRGASTVRRPDNKNGNFWVELEIPHMGRSKPEDNETDAKPW